MKVFIHCRHHNKVEKDALEKAGYAMGMEHNADPMVIVKKVHEVGSVNVAVSPVKHTDEVGEHCHIFVADRQR